MTGILMTGILMTGSCNSVPASDPGKPMNPNELSGEPSKPPPKNRAPWIRGGRPVPRAVRGPVHDFLQLEVAGGGALLVATVAALVVANSPAAAGVEEFFA